MTIYAAADLLTGLAESLMMFMLYGTFCKKRENVPPFVYMMGLILLAVMINISNIMSDYGILNSMGMTLSFFAVSFLYKGNIKTRAVISALNFLLIVVIEIAVLYGIVLMCRVSVADVVEIPFYRLLGIIISKTVSLLTVNVIRLKYKKKQILYRASYWILFLLMFATSIVAVFLIFRLSYGIKEKYMYNLSVLCSLGLFVSTFFALFLYERLAEQADTIYSQRRHEQYLRSQIKHLDEILASQKQIKKFKHDFSHCLIGLKGFIDSKDYNKAESYIATLSETFSRSSSVIETGNTALDAVLSAKKALAESKNIIFKMKIQIPENLPVEPIDLCVIFGNALDNAIEACERIDNRNKNISLVIICRANTLFCKITNTAPAQKDLFFVTSKEDKNNHGFGLENIKTVLEKYESEPEIEYSDNLFTLKFVIFLRE